LETEKSGLYFDVIGFDPRGVNYSTPSARCFPDDMASQQWSVESRAEGYPITNESFGTSWARSTALARSCSSRLGSKDDDVMEIGRFMNTPTVAEDMVAIIEALGEWREEEAKKAINKGHCNMKDISEILDRTKWSKGKEKLQYWGFSYGTILGMTFSAMHPDRVGRVIVDGVMEASDYYNGKFHKDLLIASN
jgi:pimeloyl-ACP methyl ester carboxylesterase